MAKPKLFVFMKLEVSGLDMRFCFGKVRFKKKAKGDKSMIYPSFILRGFEISEFDTDQANQKG